MTLNAAKLVKKKILMKIKDLVTNHLTTNFKKEKSMTYFTLFMIWSGGVLFGLMIFWVTDPRKKAMNKLQRSFFKSRSDKAELGFSVRHLFWAIANQKEKVPSHLKPIIDEVYDGYCDEKKYEIKDEILKGMSLK